MKKLLMTLCLFTYVSGYAQFTMTGGSGTSFAINAKNKFINVGGGTSANSSVYSYDLTAVSAGIFLYPKYHLKQEKPGRGETAKPYSLSVGLPTILGFQAGFNGNSFTYSIYPTADINIGSCNINTRQKAIGAYLGLGFGIHNTNNAIGVNATATTQPFNSDYQTVPNLVYDGSGNAYIIGKGIGKNIGPMVHIGFEFPSLFYRGSKSGLRIAYQPAINKQGPNYFTLCLQQAFGGNRF